MTVTNQFTSAGLNAILDGGLTAVQFPYIGIGTGEATFSLSLNAMGNETYRAAILDSLVVPSGVLANQRLALDNTNGNGTLKEIGAFDAAAAGNLLRYKTFHKSLVKTDDEDAMFNMLAAIRNGTTTPCLTWKGLAAMAAGGVTTTTFPYISVHDQTIVFVPTMTEMPASSELARGATSVAIVAAVATISRTFGVGVGTGTWKSVAVWDASSGGNLLAAMNGTSTPKGAGVSLPASLALTIQNAP